MAGQLRRCQDDVSNPAVPPAGRPQVRPVLLTAKQEASHMGRGVFVGNLVVRVHGSRYAPPRLAAVLVAVALRLQPYLPEAATLPARGRNPTCQRLQPYLPEAATPFARGCTPTLYLLAHVREVVGLGVERGVASEPLVVG